MRARRRGWVCPRGAQRRAIERVVQAAANNEAVVPRSMVLELVLELRGGGSRRRRSDHARVPGAGNAAARDIGPAEIAERLAIAPVTVRRHISELVRKLGVENRAALTAVPAMAADRAADGRAVNLNGRALRLIAAGNLRDTIPGFGWSMITRSSGHPASARSPRGRARGELREPDRARGGRACHGAAATHRRARPDQERDRVDTGGDVRAPRAARRGDEPAGFRLRAGQKPISPATAAPTARSGEPRRTA